MELLLLLSAAALVKGITMAEVIRKEYDIKGAMNSANFYSIRRR